MVASYQVVICFSVHIQVQRGPNPKPFYQEANSGSVIMHVIKVMHYYQNTPLYLLLYNCAALFPFAQLITNISYLYHDQDLKARLSAS